MTVWSLPRVTFRELSSIQESRPIALLTTDDVWAVLGSQLSLPVVIQAEPERYSRDLFEYLADHLPGPVEAIYAVGRGAVVQAAKLIAAQNNKPLIVVPTALDSDAMLTSTAETHEQSGGETHVVHLETGPATEIVIDWAVIESAPDDLRGAGIVDILSIITGLLDWRFAARKGKNLSTQRFVPWAAGVVAGLASQAIKSAAAIGQGQPEALSTLLNLLMINVQTSNLLGHVRARQGGEHYLAQMLTGQISSKLSYAEIIGPGLLFVAALHGQDPAPLRDALTSAGIKLDRLNATDVRLTLNALPIYLEEYGFPYSILNTIDPASEQVAQALDTAGLALEAETWELPEETQPFEIETPDIEEVLPASETPLVDMVSDTGPAQPTQEEPVLDDTGGADEPPDVMDGTEFQG